MKTIKIPKLPEEETFEVGIIKGKSTDRILVLKKQTILGVNIPKESEIHIDNFVYRGHYNHSGNIAYVRGEYINVLLRYLYIQKLRNVK